MANYLRKLSFNLMITLLLSFVSNLSSASFSSPPIIVDSRNCTSPTIASDPFGNCIAVWYNINPDTESVYLQGAVLPYAAENSEGQPAWILTSPVSLDVSYDGITTIQNISVDAQGNALVAWSDALGTNILVSRLLAGETTWTTPASIGTPTTGPYVYVSSVDVAPNGNAIVAWINGTHPYDYPRFANVYDAQNQEWKGQLSLFLGAPITGDLATEAAIDSSGNAIILIQEHENAIYTASYKFSSNTWANNPTITTNHATQSSIARDPSGNTILVWNQDNNELYGALLPAGETTFGSPILLSTTANIESTLNDSGTFPVVKTTQEGNALAIWSDLSDGLGSARYVGGTWQTLPVLLLGPTIIPIQLSLSLNSNGDAVAAWTIFNETSFYIQTAMLKANASLWETLTTISDLEFNQNPQAVITFQGESLVIWESDLNFLNFDTSFLYGTINSSVYSVAPEPPSNFTYKIKRNRFASQVSYPRVLHWIGSETSNVINYRLYRNKVQIATIQANQTQTYTFYDQGLSPYVTYIYTLVGVDTNGLTSYSLTLVSN